jgi:hypothetical protein
VKLVLSLLKGIQTGGGFGVLAAVLAWSPFSFKELLFLSHLGLGFAVAGALTSLGLCFTVEKRRGLIGGGLLIFGIFVAIVLAPPQIQR